MRARYAHGTHRRPGNPVSDGHPSHRRCVDLHCRGDEGAVEPAVEASRKDGLVTGDLRACVHLARWSAGRGLSEPDERWISGEGSTAANLPLPTADHHTGACIMSHSLPRDSEVAKRGSGFQCSYRIHLFRLLSPGCMVSARVPGAVSTSPGSTSTRATWQPWLWLMCG